MIDNNLFGKLKTIFRVSKYGEDNFTNFLLLQLFLLILIIVNVTCLLDDYWTRFPKDH